ncbi:trypsin inhibitor like cysteine rich domain-containing protein [Ditylenchus destructor]|nr:trypsin inhibitor like cysteine rich domain-containing protein [Ditylenchus destructor]
MSDLGELPPYGFWLGLILFLCSFLPACFTTVILCSLFSLAKKRPMFVLLFNHGLAEISMLSMLIWLSVEIMADARFIPPFHTDSLIFRFVSKSEHYLALVMAINRAHSVILPLRYSDVWTKRTAIASSCCCWSFCFLLSAFVNYGLPATEEQFIIHSLPTFNYVRLKPAPVQAAIENYTFLFVIILSLVIYVAVLIRLLYDHLWSKAHLQHLNNTRLAKEMQDRVQIFVICLSSVLPYGITYAISYTFKMKPPYGTFILTLSNCSCHFITAIWLMIIAIVFVFAVMVQISAALLCPENEVISHCGGACEPSCERPDTTGCIGCARFDACVCKPGLVRLDNKECGNVGACKFD